MLHRVHLHTEVCSIVFPSSEQRQRDRRRRLRSAVNGDGAPLSAGDAGVVAPRPGAGVWGGVGPVAGSNRGCPMGRLLQCTLLEIMKVEKTMKNRLSSSPGAMIIRRGYAWPSFVY